MSLTQRDKNYIWHPLTQHKITPNSLPIIKAKGVNLFDEKGNKYIDAISSWYTAMYGHCNKYIVEKTKRQLEKLDQIVFAGLTHEPAIELSEKLIKILPNNQQKIFFSDNGSTAVDTAIKMAIQYFYNQQEDKDTLIAFENGFHGDTFGAMSVSGIAIYNMPFKQFFIKTINIPTPNGSNNDEVLEKLNLIIKNNKVAAFIYEPIVQGAAAMKMHCEKGLNKIIKYCKQNNVLTIADEVMTGFGKTGKNFASEYLNTNPDIICLSKALTAGVVPMAITSCTQRIFDVFYSNNIKKGFFHGHTYSANPIACTVAIAGIELLQSKEIKNNIKNITQWHQEFNQEIKKHKNVKSTRQKGVIYVIDLNIKSKIYSDVQNKLYQFFINKGIILRPLANTIYILAPYTIEKKEMNKIYENIKIALELNF